jgi:two-component system sensor histidine kinase and response regulator WspE
VCAGLRAVALVLDATERACGLKLMTLEAAEFALGLVEESVTVAPSQLAAWDRSHESQAEAFVSALDESQSIGVAPGVAAATPSGGAPLVPSTVQGERRPMITTGSRLAVGDAEAGVDPQMLGLFRDELQTHLFTMSDGLTALDADAGAADRLVAVMRAAHSIKGSLRILGLDAAVTLAHVAEDRLQEALRGSDLTSRDVDVLLRTCDLFTELMQSSHPYRWVASAAPRLDALTSLIRLRGSQLDEEDERPQPPLLIGQSETRLDSTDVGAKAKGSVTDAGIPDAMVPQGAAGESSDVARSVRVTAAHLDRLLGLAGEGLTDARRLQPLARSLHQLVLQQMDLLSLMTELQLALGPEVIQGQAAQVWSRLRNRAEEVRTGIRARQDEVDDFARRNDELTRRVYRETLESRMRPFRDGVQWFPRLVRDLSRRLGRPTDFRMAGEDVRVDRDVLDKIEAPLNHLLRNALDHGIESPEERMQAGKPARAMLTLEARPWAGMLSVTVSDDGRGIDLARVRRKIAERGLATAAEVAQMAESSVLDHLFAPGFSTREKVTELSGRGVGLDVVQTAVHEVGGSVRVQTSPGRGTSFQMLLPITLSVTRAVVVLIGGEPYAMPLVRVQRLLRVPREEVMEISGRPVVKCDGEHVGLVDASLVLGLEGRVRSDAWVSVVVLRSYLGTFGLSVDAITGEQDLVVRPLDPRLGRVADILAASTLPDGEPVLILDTEDVVRSVIRMVERGRVKPTDRSANERPAPRILLVDDSITVREVERQTLTAAGYHVTVAVDGADGWQTVREHSFDLVITDVDMPRMDGLELTRSIRGDMRFRDIPVVVVSYRDREEDRHRAEEAGATHYLPKSEFREDTLLAIVASLVGVPS